MGVCDCLVYMLMGVCDCLVYMSMGVCGCLEYMLMGVCDCTVCRFHFGGRLVPESGEEYLVNVTVSVNDRAVLAVPWPGYEGLFVLLLSNDCLPISSRALHFRHTYPGAQALAHFLARQAPGTLMVGVTSGTTSDWPAFMDLAWGGQSDTLSLDDDSIIEARALAFVAVKGRPRYARYTTNPYNILDGWNRSLTMGQC